MKIIRKIFGRIYWIANVLLNTILNKIPSRRIRKMFYILMGAHIGKKSVIFRSAEVLKPLNLTIGKSSSIGWHTLIDSRGGIKIGDNVTVASYCHLVTAKHDINDPYFPAVHEPIEIDDYAWICTGASITGGVKIGKGAVVAMGAVVTHDVEPMTVVAGVPAKIIARREVEPIFEDDMKWSWLN